MTYHVTLAGQGLLLDLQSYRRSLADPFAPKTSSGARTYGDLRDEIAVLIDDYSGGEGFTRFDVDEPGRYRAGPGLDPWTEAGSVRQGASNGVINVTTATPAPAPMVSALGKLYFGSQGGQGISWDGAALASAFTLATGGQVASLAEYQGKLYIGKTGNGSIATWDGAVFTDVFITLPAPVTAVYSMGVFYRGSVAYLYLVGEAPGGCRVYYTDGAALSALRYQLNEPSCRVAPQVIGTRAVFCGVRTGVGGKTGVYTLRDSGGSELWEFTTSIDGVTLLGGSVLGDASYLVGYRGATSYPVVYRWRDGNIEPLRHTLGDSGYAGPQLGAVATGSGGVWIGFGDGSSGGFKRFDGEAWSEPLALAGGSGFGAPLSAAWFGGDLYAMLLNGVIGRVQRYRGDQYQASATLETGLIDARLAGVTKVFRSVTINHAALLASQSVQVQYRLEDTGAWTSLGTNSSVGSTTATFLFGAAVTGKLIAFRVILSGPAASSTPVRFFSLEMRCRPAPGAKRIWELECLIEGSAQMPMITLDGSNSPQTADQLSGALWGIAGQSGPLTYVDLDGVSRSVWLLSYEEKGARMSQRLGTQLRGAVRLLEA
jgi:hypothetical protein